MQKNDVAYLAAVAVLAAVMLLLLLAPGEGARSTATALWDAQFPGAGTPRPIDPAQFRELIRQRRLSNHEAAFYRNLDEEHSAPH